MIKPAALLAAFALVAAPATAKDITVQMKNFGSDHQVMVFEPAFISAAVGDKVHFVPTDMGHNAEPIEGMLPAGVVAPKGVTNKEYVLTVSKPGLYGVKCLPHYSMGMVALVKAGKGAAPNVAEASAVKLPPLAAKRMAPLLAYAAK